MSDDCKKPPDNSSDSDDSLDGAGNFGEGSSVNQARKSAGGQTCSLRTLIEDGILEAAEGPLHMDYMVGSLI